MKKLVCHTFRILEHLKESYYTDGTCYFLAKAYTFSEKVISSVTVAKRHPSTTIITFLENFSFNKVALAKNNLEVNEFISGPKICCVVGWRWYSTYCNWVDWSETTRRQFGSTLTCRIRSHFKNFEWKQATLVWHWEPCECCSKHTWVLKDLYALT